MKINFFNLINIKILVLSLLTVLSIGIVNLFNFDPGVLISSADDGLTLFKEDKLKFSFYYPADFAVIRSNLPEHSLILIEKNLEDDATDRDFIKNGSWIGVTLKESSLDMPQGKVFLDPEEYMNREASGIEGTVTSEKIQVNNQLFYKVTRLAAGTKSQIQMFYHFRGSKVFRLGIYPYSDSDPRIVAVENILNSLKFERDE